MTHFLRIFAILEGRGDFPEGKRSIARKMRFFC